MAYDDYRCWLLEGDQDALACACAYLRADVEVLEIVLQGLRRDGVGHWLRKSHNGYEIQVVQKIIMIDL